jgi:quinoprotein dehydrogenase-associated probable ABC transporter substrate-binding protein
VLTGASGEPQPERTELRVCADPNNLPFSNQQEEGFENALAHWVARDLGRTVTYTWWPQRRGFIRHTLRAGRCDVVMGIPSSFELAQPTRPYYRSTYVFVTQRDRGLDIQSFDDPILKQLRIGLHVIGDDYTNVPPAQALANRGMISNVVGYSIYGNYAQPNPPAALIDAVTRGEVDVAIAWGPLAGYFAKHSPTPLSIVPVAPQGDSPALTFVFDIAMGVRHEDQGLRVALDQFIVRRQPEIRHLLERYGVPLANRDIP